MFATTDDILNQVGRFTRLHGWVFFIETPLGNFVWNDPVVNGDGRLILTNISLENYTQTLEVSPTSFKQNYRLRDFCGEKTVVVFEMDR
jgi:hypothetical protein